MLRLWDGKTGDVVATVEGHSKIVPLTFFCEMTLFRFTVVRSLLMKLVLFLDQKILLFGFGMLNPESAFTSWMAILKWYSLL